MGRRPNPLVVEFFERGAKLDDHSNRYQHTCKRCGELFPKGRSDSLTTHLLRKCPNVTQEDRKWVFDQIQQAPEKPSNRLRTPVAGLTPSTTQQDLQPGITFQGHQQQSALDTLAEVSRRHLDYSSQRGLVEPFQERTADEFINDQAFIAQLREGAGLSNPVTTAESAGSYLYPTVSEQLQGTQTADIAFIATNPLAASPLVQAASAANRQLEQAQAQNISLSQSSSLVDPQLHQMGAAQISDRSNVDSGTDTMSWNPSIVTEPQQTFGSLSMPSNEPTSGFGLLQKSTKQKTRAHFNDTRRKEVQEIRKRGACIRCRMLKKPCSGETPCSTCRNVESARIWRATCIRTRLAEEFALWSTNLFYTRAKIELSAAVHSLEQQSLPGRIEARFSSASDLWASFSVKDHTESLKGIDPNFHNYTAIDDPEAKDVWLLDDGEAIPDKLEAYANRVAHEFIAEEPSLFMRATLQKAQTLVQAEEAEQAAKIAEPWNQKSPRTSYNLQNRLLENAVELWVHTRLLTSPDKHMLQLRYDPTKAPRQLPEESSSFAKAQNPSIHDISRTSASHALIKLQLMAATESRCSKLSRIVLNELERRLLQRQQTSRFATFLSTVILLNSVERMTGFYRSFDSNEQTTGQTYPEHVTKENGTSSEIIPTHSAMDAAWGNMSYRINDHPNFWPLETPPSALWPQGPYFANLLTMLVRMRALPPKTSQTPEGTLAVMQDYALPVHINGRPVKEQIDDQTTTAAAWLDPLKLKVGELVKKRDAELPGRHEGVEDWDMRFVAKVLLPERMR